MCVSAQLCCDASEDGNYFVVGNNGFSSSGQFDGCEARVTFIIQLLPSVIQLLPNVIIDCEGV